MARLRAPISIALGALALWLALPHFVNYDMAWSLAWGSEIAHGGTPHLDAPFAPTPHPLTTLVGVVLAPLGTGAATAILAFGCLSLAVVGWLVFALASAWFGRAAGWLAAALVLTGGPLLWFGARAYLDIPYVAMVLGALLVETLRRKAGAPVLALLATAGLLRPEAWAFAGAYAIYAVHGRDRRHALGLLGLAVSAPAGWLACDFALTGDPLHSLTWTREAAAALGRPRGGGALLTALPDKLIATAGLTVLVGGVVGLAVGLAWRGAIARLPAAALALVLATSAALTAAGMPVVMRYELLGVALLAILCAGGAVGWLVLPVGDGRRRRWSVVGLAVLGLLAVALPARLDAVVDRREQLAVQASLRADLHTLANRSLPRRSLPRARLSPAPAAGGRRWTVHPPSKLGPRAPASPMAPAGLPAAPTSDRLRLLPSGPDLIHGPASHGYPGLQHLGGVLTPRAAAPREGIRPR